MTASKQLADFAANLRFEEIPADAVRFTQWLFLDWMASAIAGSNARSVNILQKFARQMGPREGHCQIIGREETTSPLFAAFINGAASHVVEQDDLHNSSILHPATVVFPPIYAVAQSNPDISGKDFLTAAVVGYECGIRVGEFLGQSHYKVFHMTATAGTVAAAMATARLLNLDTGKMLNALGSAGTQAGGLWEFLKDAADSKQLHTAKACSDGLLAAYCSADGLTAASQILEGSQGMGAGMLSEGDVSKITDKLGQRWAVQETSFKFHASCRHTHPAADALLEICNKNQFHYSEIKRIDAFVYQAASDVLGAVDVPGTIHQSKFSMGFVLALIARYQSASVTDFTEEAIADPVNASLRSKVNMTVDAKIQALYPDTWATRVEVQLNTGEILSHTVDTPKGDPGNMFSQEELEGKAMKLAQYSGHCSDGDMRQIIDKIWALTKTSSFASEFH